MQQQRFHWLIYVHYFSSGKPSSFHLLKTTRCSDRLPKMYHSSILSFILALTSINQIKIQNNELPWINSEMALFVFHFLNRFKKHSFSLNNHSFNFLIANHNCTILVQYSHTHASLCFISSLLHFLVFLIKISLAPISFPFFFARYTEVLFVN